MPRFAPLAVAAAALVAAAPAAAHCGCVVRHKAHHGYRPITYVPGAYRPVAYVPPLAPEVVERPVYVDRPVYVERRVPVYVERHEAVAPAPVFRADYRLDHDRFDARDHERQYGERREWDRGDGWEHRDGDHRGSNRRDGDGLRDVGFEGGRDRGW